MYPNIEVLLADLPKERLLEVRRSLRSTLPALALFVASVVLVLGINLAVWEAVDSPNFTGTPSITASAQLSNDESYSALFGTLLLKTGIPASSLRWLALIPAIILLEIFRRHNDDLYVFGEMSVIHYEGRLSLNSSVPSIKYEDIKAITVDQNLVARLFDFGNILLDTPSQDGVELTITGVRAPLELTLLIEEFRDYAIRRHRTESDDRAEERRSPANEG